MTMNNGLTHLCALTIGAAAGVMVGVLTAPSSGLETRRRISFRLGEGRNRLRRTGHRVVDETASRLEHGIESGRQKLDQMLEG